MLSCLAVAAVASTGAGLLAAPQHYMQERVSWIKTNMTGGTMSALFNISNSYGALQAASSSAKGSSSGSYGGSVRRSGSADCRDTCTAPAGVLTAQQQLITWQ
jgi:hypothetical protein